MVAVTLSPSEPLESSVRHAIDVLLGDAEERLRLPGEAGLDKAIHESRKRIKEVRGLLRLFRTSLLDDAGEPVRPGANDLLRSAAQPLGPAREAAVARQTLDSLALSGNELVNRAADRHSAALAGDAPDAATDAATAVARVRSASAGWHLKADDFTAIRPGLRRLYGRGQLAMARAFRAEGEPEAWHDWRKRAKDLRYAMEFLEPAAPELLLPLRQMAKAITDQLGRDHDLAELAMFATAEGQHDVAAAAEAARVADHRAIERSGQLLWAEKPKAFVERIGAYWSTSTTVTTS
ncbi:MAG: CHAD domain-containing protein [Planctomycetota bacterium]